MDATSLLAAQDALRAILQGSNQNTFNPLGPTSPTPIMSPVERLIADQGQPAAGPSPIEALLSNQGPGNTLQMPPVTSVPQFQPLPPIEQEIASVLDIMQKHGIGVAPPAPKPLGVLQKIALALQGFGAGTQGQGPEFLANLKAQRERPALEAQRQKAQLLGQILPDIFAARERRQAGRETAVYGAERALGLEELQQTGLNTRESLKLADARLTLIGNRAAKLGELGVDAQLTQPIAEALSGLRVWTPELIQAYNVSVPAKARADLARTEAETAKTRAEAQLLPLRAKQLQADIGRIGVLNRKDLEEMNPASKKKVNEVFDFSIRQSTAPLFTRVDPVTKQRIEPTREDILKATNNGRRAAVERLGGDLRSYDQFLQKIDADPTGFGRYVNMKRQEGFNDLEILNANRGNK